MKNIIKYFVIVIALFQLQTTAQTNTLTQYSTIDALLKSNYDSQFTLKQLKLYGDFGIGTFNGVDGEMVVFEGVVYQVKADCSVNIMPDTIKTPFMTVTKFKSEIKRNLNIPLNYEKCTKFVDSLLPSPNYFYAVKITGKFKMLTTRSVPKQNKPYKPLTEVVKMQSVFNLENIEGTIVGFKCPFFANGVNVPGYHLHFLSKDKTSGGHILDLMTEDVVVEIEKIAGFNMILPEDGIFPNQDFTKDNYEDLEKVEKK
ncbi:MAG: acetolactate decarboxylase [bacterium]